MHETYEAYGNQANYVGCLTFGRLQMHPKMQGMSYEVFPYEVSHKVLVLYLTFRVCCRLYSKGSQALVEMLFILLRVSFRYFTQSITSWVWDMEPEQRTEQRRHHRTTNGEHPRDTLNPPHDYSKLVSMYFKYQSLICLHNANYLFALCCENCLFHHQYVMMWYLMQQIF